MALVHQPYIESPTSFSVSAATSRAIDELITHYPVKEAALLPALHKVQDEYGWLPVAAMNWVADKLELPRLRVYSVTSFYTMFRRQPPGKHRLEVCTNLSCSLLGAQHLREHLCQKLGIQLGETTSDGEFTLTQAECLGSCGTAPVMLVDDRFYENLTPEKVDRIVAGVREGRPVLADNPRCPGCLDNDGPAKAGRHV